MFWVVKGAGIFFKFGKRYIWIFYERNIFKCLIDKVFNEFRQKKKKKKKKKEKHKETFHVKTRNDESMITIIF
jgi:hypothetical protein